MCGNSRGPFYFAELANGWTVGRFVALDELPAVVHAVTTREGFDVDLAARQAGEADGLVTGVSRLGLAGFSADCPILLAADPVSGAVGMAHASWRATAGRIASEMIRELVDRFGATPADVVACIGPSAGPCCYEVGDDLVHAVLAGVGERAGKFFETRAGKTYFDLWSANADALGVAGLLPEHVHTAGVCTLCRNDLFPSYRLEGRRAGRFVAVISKK